MRLRVRLRLVHKAPDLDMVWVDAGFEQGGSRPM